MTWDRLPASSWGLGGDLIKQMCAPNKMEESIVELRFFRVLLIKMYIACDPDTRMLNRVLLSPLDFGKKIANANDLNIIDQSEWVFTIGKMVQYKKKKIFNLNNFSEITLPIRVGGKWMLVLCLPEYGKFQIVVFDEWEWNATDVHKMMNVVTEGL